MNAFWSITLFWAAAMTAVGLALAFVLPFLIRNSSAAHSKAARRDINLAVYRDQMKDLNTELSNTQLSQEQFLASKLELETRAAEDALAHEDRAATPVASRRLAYVLALILPAATIGFYMWLGNPNVLVLASGGQPQSSALSAQPTEADILEIIARIDARAQANPTDVETWEALANANAMMARWPEALQSFERALELSPNRAAVLSGYAEALAMMSDMLLAGAPMEKVNRALQLDPNDRKGLELSGIHAFQNQQFAETVVLLDRLLRLMSPETPYAQDISRMRNEAQRLAALSNSAPTGSGIQPSVVAGRLDVVPELVSRVGAQSTIYLIARDGESGPPLAAARVAMGSFPIAFRLDDTMVMNPANTLANHSEVVLLARISASGNPIAQPGDLEGRLVGVGVGSMDVQLVIDRVVTP